MAVRAGSLAAALVWLAAAPGARAATVWTESGPVPGAYVDTIAYSANGATAFAGGIGVVWRSTDDGLHWTAAALPTRFAHSLVLQVAPDPNNALIVLASTTDIGVSGLAVGNAVLASDDGGKTWAAGGGELTNQIESGNVQYPYYVTWDPNVPNTAYAATAAGETGDIYRTGTNGKAWTLRYAAPTTSAPIPFGPILAVPSKPTSIYMAATDFNYASDGDGYIAKSTNSAGSFSFSEPLNYIGYAGYGEVTLRFANDPTVPRIVYALVSGEQLNTLDAFGPYIELLWTPNGGINWVNRVKGLPANTEAGALAVDPASHAVLLPACCATHHQLFHSINEAASWSLLGTIQASSLALAIKPGVPAATPATLLNAGRGGVLASIDGGKTFSDRNTGLAQPSFADVVADPTTPTLVYVATKAGVWRSTDGGTTLAPIVEGLTDGNVFALALDAKAASHTLYAASLSGIYRCENPAAATPSWTDITPPAMKALVGSYALAVDGGVAGRLYVSNSRSVVIDGNNTPREIYRTDNFGKTWVTTGFNAASGNDFPQAMIADPKAPGTIYATSGDFPSVYKSTNAGASFTNVLNGQGGSKFAIGQGSGLNLRAIYLLSTDPNSGQPEIVYTTDGGTTWDSNTTATPGGNALLDIAADPVTSAFYGLVYVGTNTGGVNSYSLGVYSSPNHAFTWDAITGNLAAPLVLQPFGSVTTSTFLRATGDTLVVATPLENKLFLSTLR